MEFRYPEGMISKRLSVKGYDTHFLESGNPNAEYTFLFIHGNSSTALMWTKLMQEFVEYRCIAPDLPGFGFSKLSGTIPTPKQYIQFVFDFVFQLDLKNIIMVGHEWGVIFGAGAAIQDMGRYSKNIVFNTITEPVMKFGFSYKIGMRKAKAIFKNKIEKGTFNPMDPDRLSMYQKLFSLSPDELTENLERQIPTSKNDKFYALVLNTLSKFESWDIPSIIIFGKDDKYFSSEYAEAFARKMARTELHLLPETGHLAPEERPHEIAEIVKSWLG